MLELASCPASDELPHTSAADAAGKKHAREDRVVQELVLIGLR
jgi:hypothetical protein